MALNPATLGTALAAAAGSTDAPGIAAWNAMAAAIVAHIINNATIVVSGVAAGVTPGPSASVVTGTATIT